MDIKYTGEQALLEIHIPSMHYYHNIKVDTGASMTLLPDYLFNRFHLTSKLKDGNKVEFNGVNEEPMIGYIHKVYTKILGDNINREISICFYPGTKSLLGLDVIKQHYNMSFKKDIFSLNII